MAEDSPKLVSVVVRSLNEDKYVEKLFRGILEQTYKNAKIRTILLSFFFFSSLSVHTLIQIITQIRILHLL